MNCVRRPIVSEHLHGELVWLKTRLLELTAFRVHREWARVAAGATTEAAAFEALAPRLHGLLHSHALNAELLDEEDTIAVADALACGVASLDPNAVRFLFLFLFVFRMCTGRSAARAHVAQCAGSMQLCTLFFDMRALRLRHRGLFTAASASAARHARALHPMGLSHMIAACADLGVTDEGLISLAVHELEARIKARATLRVTTVMRAFTALAKVCFVCFFRSRCLQAAGACVGARWHTRGGGKQLKAHACSWAASRGGSARSCFTRSPSRGPRARRTPAAGGRQACRAGTLRACSRATPRRSRGAWRSSTPSAARTSLPTPRSSTTSAAS